MQFFPQRMFYIFVTIFCSTFASPPVMEIPAVYFTSGFDTVPSFNFYPEGKSQFVRANVRVLPFGEPSNRMLEMIHSIENIPVEKRTMILEKFASRSEFKTYHKMIAGWYSKYVVSSYFIDVRLLRLLHRFAHSKMNKDEINIRSACDIVAHMWRKFPGAFEYLTPQYVMGWYSVLGSYHKCNNISIYSYSYRTSRDPAIRSAILSGDESVTAFVTLTPLVWSACILRSRIHPLLSTGYEFAIQPN